MAMLASNDELIQRSNPLKLFAEKSSNIIVKRKLIISADMNRKALSYGRTMPRQMQINYGHLQLEYGHAERCRPNQEWLIESNMPWLRPWFTSTSEDTQMKLYCGNHPIKANPKALKGFCHNFFTRCQPTYAISLTEKTHRTESYLRTCHT